MEARAAVQTAIKDSILGAIGDTPLVRLSRIGAGLRPQLVAKVEALNPGGSIKDRIAVALIEAAERDGLLRPGGTLVEPTSGNTGTGLAIAARLKGYRVIAVMPDKMSREKIDLLRAYGAEVVIGADPVGSIFSGDEVHPYLVEGVGEDFWPATYDPSVVDRYVRVSDRDAFLTTRRLAETEGMLVGGSCGLAVHAALEGAGGIRDPAAMVAVILP